MPSERVFFSNFNTLVPSEFSGYIKRERVQRYNGIGTGTDVFSGQFLRNDSGGDAGGGGVQGAPQIKTTLTFSGLLPHTSIDLNFLLAAIDSWDGSRGRFGPDIFNVTVDGRRIFSQSFRGSYVPPEEVFLGTGNYGFNLGLVDDAYNLGLDPAFDNIPHRSSNLKIEWFASGRGWQGGTDESWAIDNVEVILNGVPDVLINIDDVSIREGNSGIKNANFTVSLSRPSNNRITVDYFTSNNTATASSDYRSETGILTFLPGQTEKIISIPIVGDTTVEYNEIFGVNINNSVNAIINDSLGLGTIINDDRNLVSWQDYFLGKSESVYDKIQTDVLRDPSILSTIGTELNIFN